MPFEAEVRGAIATAWLHQNVSLGKWQCPCGKVLLMTQGPTTKSYLTQDAAGAKHKDWVTYGKQVMEPFVSGGGTGFLLLPGIMLVTGVI